MHAARRCARSRTSCCSTCACRSWTGYACLDAIRKRCPDVKVVVLSAFSDREHIQAAFSRGATAYIVKSVNPVDLPSALRQAVEATVFSAIRLLGDGDAATPNDSRPDGARVAILRARRARASRTRRSARSSGSPSRR